MLRVNIRSAETISWYKNGILLKEGADGGRVTGVHTNTLVFTKLLPRDKGAKVTAHGKNKWGKVETTPCELMVPAKGAADDGGAGRNEASSAGRKEMLSDMLEASKSFAQGKFGRKRGETKQEEGGDETAAPTISISMNADI